MEIRFYEPHGEYGWLANFSRHAISIDGRVWPTVEHYFQGQKFPDRALQERIRTRPSPSAAKRLAKELKARRRADWRAVRDDIMATAIRAKFLQHADLGERLLATANAPIIEDAADDAYWGIGHGSGRNRMGELLMALRGELHDRLRRAA